MVAARMARLAILGALAALAWGQTVSLTESQGECYPLAIRQHACRAAQSSDESFADRRGVRKYWRRRSEPRDTEIFDGCEEGRRALEETPRGKSTPRGTVGSLRHGRPQQVPGSEEAIRAGPREVADRDGCNHGDRARGLGAFAPSCGSGSPSQDGGNRGGQCRLGSTDDTIPGTCTLGLPERSYECGACSAKIAAGARGHSTDSRSRTGDARSSRAAFGCSHREHAKCWGSYRNGGTWWYTWPATGTVCPVSLNQTTRSRRGPQPYAYTEQGQPSEKGTQSSSTCERCAASAGAYRSRSGRIFGRQAGHAKECHGTLWKSGRTCSYLAFHIEWAADEDRYGHRHGRRRRSGIERGDRGGETTRRADMSACTGRHDASCKTRSWGLLDAGYSTQQQGLSEWGYQRYGGSFGLCYAAWQHVVSHLLGVDCSTTASTHSPPFWTSRAWILPYHALRFQCPFPWSSSATAALLGQLYGLRMGNSLSWVHTYHTKGSCA